MLGSLADVWSGSGPGGRACHSTGAHLRDEIEHGAHVEQAGVPRLSVAAGERHGLLWLIAGRAEGLHLPHVCALRWPARRRLDPDLMHPVEDQPKIGDVINLAESAPLARVPAPCEHQGRPTHRTSRRAGCSRVSSAQKPPQRRSLLLCRRWASHGHGATFHLKVTLSGSKPGPRRVTRSIFTVRFSVSSTARR